MGRTRKERPDGVVFFSVSLQQLRLLPDIQAGRVVKAAATLFLEDIEPSGLELSEQLVFSSLRADIGASLKSFRDRCARNKAIADAREGARDVSKRDDTQREETIIEENLDEMNGIEQKRKTDKPPRSARFTPPTVEEVAEYCRERGNGINAQAFVDHYQANGWTRGKTKIKDWRACVRTWERSEHIEKTGARDIRDQSRYENREGSL